MSLSLPLKPARELSTEAAPSSAATGFKPLAGLKKAIKITPDEIQLFSNYIYAISGIHIDASKAYLLETRLGKLLESARCDSYSAFYHAAKADASKGLERQIVNAITTNETLFFRDNSPFDLLKHKILPEVIDAQSRKTPPGAPVPIRIWSAACSTGQEIISIAITLRELLGPATPYVIKLLGTDLSDAAIAQASSGIYNKFEIERGLPKDRLQRYFVAQGGNWKIKDEIRSMASYQKLNLMLPFQHLGKFDIIFCRNVAIYFTLEDRKKLFDKIASAMDPDGFLIIGSTESLTGVCPRLIPKRHLKSIFYQVR